MKLGIKVLAALSALAANASAQITTAYTDPTTGIDFQRIVPVSTTSFSFGIALPQSPTSNSEFIGQITGPISTGTSVGYSGVSLGGGMANNLLIVAWKDGNTIRHSFRMSNGYVCPSIYTGNAVATTMYTEITSTSWTWTFRCQNCATWTTFVGSGGFDTSGSIAVMGWAQSTAGVVNPSDSNSAISFHNDFGMFGVDLANAWSSQYYTWLA